MRIAVVTMSFLPRVGGAEFVVHHLATQWSRQGHEVCVMNACSDAPPQPDAGYGVRRFRVLRGSDRLGHHRFPLAWYIRKQMARLLKEFRPDAISAQFGYPTAWLLSGLRPVPRYLVTCHGTDLTTAPWGYRARFGIDPLLRHALNASAGAVAISSHAAQLMEELGVARDRILRIPNGVEWAKFQREVGVDFRDQLGLPRGAVVVLSVGREHPAKGYGTGIEAFARAAPKVPDLYYCLVGRGVECWKGLTERLGVASRVILCPGLYGENLIAAYRQSNIFFSPSVQEMFPLVVVEAMAAGLPAVVTNVSGSQDAVQSGDNGLVVEPGDTDAMADALARLAADAPLRETMSVAGRARAKLYDWENVSHMYLERM